MFVGRVGFNDFKSSNHSMRSVPVKIEGWLPNTFSSSINFFQSKAYVLTGLSGCGKGIGDGVLVCFNMEGKGVGEIFLEVLFYFCIPLSLYTFSFTHPAAR